MPQQSQRKGQNDVDTYQVREWSGEAMAAALANWVNGATRDDFMEFAAKLCKAEHRTLQQQAWQVMKLCIAQWAFAKGDGRYDLRNEQTVTEAEKIRNLLAVPPLGDLWTFTTLI
jgi:hypothetical protein